MSARLRDRLTWIVLTCGVTLATCLLAACGGKQKGPDPAHLMTEERYEPAMKAYRERLEANPADKAAREGYDAARRALAARHQQAAAAAERERDLNRALKELDAALGLDPELAAARLDESRIRRQRTQLSRRLVRAEKALEAGDCLRARSELDAMAAWRPTFGRIEERREEALKRCFDEELRRAQGFAELGHAPGALRHLDAALSYYPKHPRVAELRKRVEDETRCREDLIEAEALLRRSDSLGATRRFRTLLARCPDHEAGKKGLARARSAGLRRSLDAGSAALKKGDALAALRAFEEALELGIEDAALQERTQALAASQRNTVAAQLYAMGERAEQGALYGAARVRFLLADRVGRGFLDAGARAAKAETAALEAARLAVGVPPVENPTPHAWLGKELGQELVQRLKKDLGDLATVELGYRGSPDLLVAGRLTRFSIDSPEPELRPRDIQYPVGVRRETNPALGEKLALLVQARRTLRDHSGAPEAAKAASDAHRALSDTRTTLTRGETATFALPVARLRIEGEGAGSLELIDRSSSRRVGSYTASAEYSAEEAIWEAFEPGGVEAHEGKLPEVRGVRRRLVLDLVEAWSKKLLPELRRVLAERLSRRASSAKGEEALHYWSLMEIAATGEQKKAAAAALHEAVGFTSEGYDVKKLSL